MNPSAQLEGAPASFKSAQDQIVRSLRPTRPRLAEPIRPKRPLPFFKYFRVSRDNFIAGFHENLYSEPIFERKFLWFRSFIINDPDGIRRVLLDNPANYVKAEILRPVLGPALGTGLITSDGEAWRCRRKLIAPVLDPRSVDAYGSVMVDATQALIHRWAVLPNGSVVDVKRDMSALALEIISRAMFSSDSADMVDVIELASSEYQDEMTFSFCGFVPVLDRVWGYRKTRHGRHIVQDLDRAIYRLISNRFEKPELYRRKDLLTRLITARDVETGSRLSAQEIRDHVVTIMMAGYETTATALTWIWYLLSQHPDEEATLRRELDDVLRGRTPTTADLVNLPCTRMIIQEGLRLYPPVHTLSWRQAVADDEICGRHIPKGSIIWIAPWLLHRNPLTWRNPDAFEPDRFSEERSARRSRFAYLPFSTGPRTCIGATFAMTEAEIILASIGQRYELRLIEGHSVDPQGLVTLRPRHGLRMSLHDRRNEDVCEKSTLLRRHL